MAEITFSGLASGLATDDIVTKLMAVERKPLDRLENEKTYETNRLKAYGQLNSRLQKLREAVAEMNLTSKARTTAVELSSTGVFTATSSGAALGSYDVAVSQLAQVQKSVSSGYSSSTTSLFGSGTITVGSKTITIDSTNNSLQGMMAAINKESASTGVSATIINDGSGGSSAYRMVLTGKDAATAFTVTSNLQDSGGTAIPFAVTDSQTAQQAKLTVDGIEVVSNSNTVTGVISGLTLNLTGTSPVASEGPPVVYQTTKMTVTADTEALQEKITTFVSAYNDIMDWIKAGYDEDAGQETADTESEDSTSSESTEEENLSYYLRGDATVNTIKRGLQSILSSTSGAGSLQILSQAGISTNMDGTLSVNSSKLESALQENFTGVAELLAGSDTTDGVMDKFNSYLVKTTSVASGMYAEKRNRYSSKVDRLDMQIEQKTALLEKIEASMKARFAAMEQMVSNLNSLSSYITQISSQGN